MWESFEFILGLNFSHIFPTHIGSMNATKLVDIKMLAPKIISYSHFLRYESRKIETFESRLRGHCDVFTTIMIHCFLSCTDVTFSSSALFQSKVNFFAEK